MKTLLILAALAIPAAASAQDSCCRRPPPRRVETCRARTVPETYTVRVPYRTWVFDWCSFRWVERCGYRYEERTRYRTVWTCVTGCRDHHHDH